MPSPPRFTSVRWRLTGAALSAALATATAHAQTEWNIKASNTPEMLSGITFADGQFVIVGEEGVILTSPDGENWSAQNSGVDSALRSITFGNGVLLAVGQSGTALTSPDGVNWTARDPRTSSFLSAATFGDGVFVAVGGGGTARFSTDGADWDLGLGTPSNFLQTATFGDGQFVAAGLGGRIVRSADGQTWVTSSSGTSAFLSAAAHFDGVFYIGGQNGTMLRSPDGVAWSRVDIGTFEWIKGLGAGNGKLVAVGDQGTVLVSTNGTTWAPADPGVTTNINSVAFGAGAWVAAGAPNGDPLTGLILKAQDVVIEPAKTFASWSAEQFSPAELGDPSISGPGSDPDGDGLTNFEEYAFGTAPKTPSPGPVVRPTIVDEGGATRLAIDFQRPVECVGFVTYRAEGSSDLENWDGFGGQVEILGDDGTLQQVRITDLELSGDLKAVRLVLGESEPDVSQ